MKNLQDTLKKKNVSYPQNCSTIDIKLNANNCDTNNKENHRPATLRSNTKTVVQTSTLSNTIDYRDESNRPKSIYSTPRRAPITGIFSPALYRR